MERETNMTKLHISLVSVLITGLLGGCSGSSENKVESKPKLANSVKPAPVSAVTLQFNKEAVSVTPTSLSLTKDQSGVFTIKTMPGYKIEQISGCSAKLSEQHNTITLNGATQDCTITIIDKMHIANVAITSTVSGLGELLNLPQSVQEGSPFSFDSKARSGHKIKSISGCGVTKKSQNNWHVSNAKAPCHITATFESKFQMPEASKELIKLPIVVHTFDNATTVISDAQIHAQLSQLNRHFRAESLGNETATVSTTSAIATQDTGIQFYLASITPSGEATSGINRIAHSDIVEPLSTNKPEWDTSRYINVWVGDFTTITGLKLGKTTHMPTDSNNPIGIVIDSSVFNTDESNVLAKPAKQNASIEQIKPVRDGLNTVLTHQVGHFLGLPGYVVDSPKTLPCDVITTQNDLCANQLIHLNFMRETALGGNRQLFTKSQVKQMRTTLTSGALKPLYDNSQAR